jgi:hypothetical protein
MKAFTRDSASNLSCCRIAAVLAFFALNLAVYLIRILSVWRYGALFCATSVESPMIDSIWRCMHHRPVYAWPFTFPFSLSLYNYLFYNAYARVLTLIGAWDAGILTWGRQLTLLFALAGGLAQWRLVRSLLKLRGAASALSLLLSVGLWLCTSLVKYWAIAIRPDMAAAALVMIALWIIVRQPRFAFAYAGVLLYLAWAFKQSVVLAFASLCLWLLLKKRWRDLAMLAAVFAALVAATLLLGTPEYRFSILVAPQMVKGFSFGLPWILHALGTGLTAVLLNLYWVAAPLVLARASGGTPKTDAGARKSSLKAGLCQGTTSVVPQMQNNERGVLPAAEKLVECVLESRFVSGHDFSRAVNGAKSTRALAPEECFSGVQRFLSLLTTVFAIALIVGLAGMGKVGGTSNYLFEAFAAGSTLLQLAVFTVPGRLVTSLLLFGCVQPAVQIAGVAIGFHHQGKRDMVPIATATEYADAVTLRNRLAAMKKPIFTTDGAFEIPWLSTDNGAPAITIDPNFQEVARTREVKDGIEGMLQRGEIPTVMLATGDVVYRKSLNPSYRKVGESIQQGTVYNIYQFDAVAP